MNLTDQHIDYISQQLDLYGLKNKALKDDLTDHICTYIENSNELNFEIAYKKAINEFGGHFGLNHIEQQTKLQLYFNSLKNRNRLLYISGYISVMCIAIGALFKIMHWPFASMILFFGFLILVLFALPVFFYSRYKDKIIKHY